MTAFLYAPLDPVEDGVILVQPPSLLAKLGVAQPDVLWKLKKSLYGLRCAPKRWSTTRDECIKTLETMDDEWGAMRCVQCPTFKN
eukprot:9009170-Prorocentrum_lima.AAC.1